MVCCATAIVKILLGIFNFCFLLLGGGITYIGFTLKNWDKDYTEALKIANIDFKSLPIIILSIGIILVLISFFGFFGACCENSFMLNTYGFLMVIMVGGQIFALYYSIHHKYNFEEKISTGFKNAMSEINNNNGTKVILNKLQCSLKCCGWDSSKDYNGTLPASCCGFCKTDEGNKECKEADLKFTKGCQEEIPIGKLNTLFGSTFGVSAAIILFEFILIFAACCLAREF